MSESGSRSTGRKNSKSLEKVKTVIKAIKTIFVLSFLFTGVAVYAQVAESARGGQATLSAGGEFSDFQSDYGGRLMGAGAIVDFNLTPKVGAIGEARWLEWKGTGDETQTDYLLGAKYRFYRHGRFSFDAKILAGGVWIKFPDQIGTGSYFAYAPGAFVDYRLSRRFLIRGDYEYQILPTAPNIPGQPSNGLTPNGASVGLEYNIFHTR